MKRATEKQRNVEQQGVIKEASYHINPENITHITQILRNMYSAPVLAVIREYAANAVDAHTQAGIGDRPIEVSIPTALNPIFKVRDFGGGLTVEETEELLYGFGSSGEHKQNSNEQIGGFGIGCKCAFAIADSFTYTVINGGKKRIWTCYLDELDNGKASMQSESDCDEEAGIEVSIPVSPDLIESFQSHARYAFRFFATKPNVVGMEDGEEIIHGTPVPAATADLKLKDKTDNEDWKVKVKFFEPVERISSYYDKNERAEIMRKQLSAGVVMGGIRYAFDWDECGVKAKDEETGNMWENISQRIVVEAPIGWVQLAPNREALQYSKRTKAMFQALFSVFTNKFLNDLFNVEEDGISIATRIQRLMTVDELVAGNGQRYRQSNPRAVKAMNECLKKYSPNWSVRSGSHYYAGEMFPLNFTGNTDPFDSRTVATVKHDWAMVQRLNTSVASKYIYDGNHYQNYLPIDDYYTTSGAAQLDGSMSAAMVGFKTNNTRVLVNFISNDLADILRETGNDESVVHKEKGGVIGYMAIRQILYDDCHEDMHNAILNDERRDSKLGRFQVITFRVRDKKDIPAVKKAFGIPASDTLLFADDVITELPTGETMKEYRGYKRKPVNRRGSSGGGSGNRNTYAQHSAKWFKCNDTTYPEPASTGWDVNDLSELETDEDFVLPVVTLDRFEICGAGTVGSGWANSSQRSMLAKGEVNGLWEALFGIKFIPAIRIRDFDKLQKKGDIKMCGLNKLLKQKVTQPIIDGPYLDWVVNEIALYEDRQNKSDGNPVKNLFLKWCKQVVKKELTCSDRVKETIEQLVAKEDETERKWLIDTILDGDDSQYDNLMSLITLLFNGIRHTPEIEKAYEKRDARGYGVSRSYSNAVAVVVAEVPQAWPLLMCDRKIGCFTKKITRSHSGMPALLPAVIINSVEDAEERKKVEDSFWSRYDGIRNPFDTGYGIQYMEKVVLPSMTKAITTAETQETK